MSGTPVLIVGGGIGGLTAAIALDRAGIAYDVYEQAPELLEVGAGIGLWPNAILVYDRFGIGDEVRALSGPAEVNGVRMPDGRWLNPVRMETIVERYGAPIAGMHRADLQSTLARHVDPERLHVGARCVEISQDEASVTVRFADGRVVSGRGLIGADGFHSVVRRHVLGDTPQRYLGYTAWRGISSLPSRLQAWRDAFETWGRGERIGAMRISRDRALWFATVDTPEGGRDEGDAVASLRDRFSRWHEPIPSLLEATVSVVRTDVHDRPRAPRWTLGRITLLGDAAHPMSPDLAQGGCQAAEDAEALARFLTEAADIQTAFRAYERERKRRADRIVRWSRLVGRVAQLSGPATSRLRGMVARTAPEWVQLRGLDQVLDLSPRRATSPRTPRVPQPDDGEVSR